MDIVIQSHKSRWWQSKVVLGGALIVVAIALVVYTNGAAQIDVAIPKDRVVVAQVKKGPMQIKVSGNGLLVPDQIQWLATRVDGKVEKVYVKAGAQVALGQPLVQLSNPELQQLADEFRWAYEAEEAKFNALKVDLESKALVQESRVVQAKFAFQSAKLQLKAETTLMNQANGVISQIDYQKTQLEVSQLEQIWHIEQGVRDKFSENAVAQIKAQQAEVNRLKNMLLRAEDQVESLTIYASMNGIVQQSALEVGQQVTTGSNVAKIANPNSLIAEVNISELIASDITIGQYATVDTRAGVIEGEVIRVDPAVVNGNVQVDIKLTSALTANARPDLSITGEITVTNLPETLYVTRPAFAQANRQSVLFKLDDSGYANKVPVSLGKASTNQIQILSGLNNGDEIVISDTSDWAQYQTVLLN